MGVCGDEEASWISDAFPNGFAGNLDSGLQKLLLAAGYSSVKGWESLSRSAILGTFFLRGNYQFFQNMLMCKITTLRENCCQPFVFLCPRASDPLVVVLNRPQASELGFRDLVLEFSVE